MKFVGLDSSRLNAVLDRTLEGLPASTAGDPFMLHNGIELRLVRAGSGRAMVGSLMGDVACFVRFAPTSLWVSGKSVTLNRITAAWRSEAVPETKGFIAAVYFNTLMAEHAGTITALHYSAPARVTGRRIAMSVFERGFFMAERGQDRRIRPIHSMAEWDAVCARGGEAIYSPDQWWEA